MFRTRVAVCTVLIAGAVVAPARTLAQANIDWLGEQAGAHEIGTIREVWFDDARRETFVADAGGNRMLSVQVWYPAAVGGEPRSVYAPEIADYDDWSLENWGPGVARATRSYEAPAISTDRESWPVVIFSHGFGVPVFSSSYLTEYLATEGFIVVGIGHTGWDARMRYPNGRAIPELAPPPPDESLDNLPHVERYRASAADPYMLQRRDTALTDIEFVLDELARRKFAGSDGLYVRMDLSTIGALGYSMGGADVFEASLSESRIAAVVNLDGGLNGYTVLDSGTDRPALLIQAANAFGSVSSGPTDPGLEELANEVERSLWRMLRVSGGPWYLAMIDGAVHPSFSDAFLVSDSPDGVIDPGQAHRIVQSVTLEFFQRYLMGAATTPILDHASSFDGLRLITRSADAQ